MYRRPTQKSIPGEDHPMKKENTYTDCVTLPVIPLRGLVAFPGVQLSLEMFRDFSKNALLHASAGEGHVFLVTQKDAHVETPAASDLYTVGTVAVIKKIGKNDDGEVTALFEGLCRARIRTLSLSGECPMATVHCRTVSAPSDPTGEQLAMMNVVRQYIADFKKEGAPVPDEIIKAANEIENPGLFADFIASAIVFDFRHKQKILEAASVGRRLTLLGDILEAEGDILRTEAQIHRKVKTRMDDHQKEYFLREQVKAIQEELGEDDDEIEEYRTKIDASGFPDEVKAKLYKELTRLDKTPFGAAESTVLRNYLDICLELPLGKTTREQPDVAKAEKILNADHDGMDKVKERILEYIAVRQLSPDVKNQILCLVGPPGVGKTSIAASVARALGRKYARVSLGGIRDEADIRGHRKTYVGAMPGRIIDAITNAGSMNPLIVLDEIDKLANDSRGDPASALLEVLDPEQNKFFRDHYIEFPVDLSDCMFIATANEYAGIPEPLLDRMEVIELGTYSRREKIDIANHHLIPKQMKRHGLTKRQFALLPDGLIEVIEGYTREAGVRNLEREIASLCRKAAKDIATGKLKSVKLDHAAVNAYLGKRKILPETIDETDPVGVVNGLAYTVAGGDLLKVEVAVMEGTGKLNLTGSLGDVMKESAEIALSYVRTIADRYHIDPTFYKTKDIHIHFPEGAVPKDGPSAGVTMTCALVSALTGRPVRRDVAMTGEVSLHGKVLPIGGLKEKTLAAYSRGVTTVLIPRENERDLDDIDKDARAGLRFILCDTVEDNLRYALLPEKAPVENKPFPAAIPLPDTKNTISACEVR